MVFKILKSRVILFLCLYALVAQVQGLRPSVQTWREAANRLPADAFDSIDTVRVVFMNHLDVGFTNTEYNVIDKYLRVFLPGAAAVSAAARLLPNESFLYTTHPWLLSYFFDCPDDGKIDCPLEDEMQAVREEILKDGIYWHAFPFNGEAETMDASIFKAAINMSKSISEKFGKPAPITMTQRDVPGTTRAIIPLLVESGIKALSVGVNGASAPPAVPEGVFIWRDIATNTEIYATWHPCGYGGIGSKDIVVIPGFNEALAIDFKSDNSGPQNLVEVVENMLMIRAEFPGANVIASTFDAFFEAVAVAKPDVAIVTSEIGDTWVYGCASDPWKLAATRELMRARVECISSGKCDPTSYAMQNFTRYLMKNTEHTWGLSIGHYLADWTNWANKDFEKVRVNEKYIKVEKDWVAQKSFVIDGVASLDKDMPSFASECKSRLEDLNAKVPSVEGYLKLEGGQPLKVNSRFTVTFDSSSGSIVSMQDSKLQRNWAGTSNPLGTFLYQTFNETDFNYWVCQHYSNVAPNCWSDFTKPGISKANPPPQHKTWDPKSVEIKYKAASSSTTVLVHITMPDYSIEYCGSPVTVWTEYVFEEGSGTVSISLQWFNKTATRMPESLWFAFNPVIAEPNYWAMDKLGQLVSPIDILKNGSFNLHGIDSGVSYSHNGLDLAINSLDAGLVSFGTPFILPGNFNLPDMTKGLAYNLFNNIWGTNYIMWYPYQGASADSKFRFFFEF